MNRLNFNTALGGRIARLRDEYISYDIDEKGNEKRTYGLKQCELARIIEEKAGGDAHLSTALISAWETGRRPVPEKYMDILADIFGCTRDYLSGLSDEKNKTKAQSRKGKKKPDTLYEIRFEELDSYDKEPIYCVFSTMEFPNGWMLYDASCGRMLFTDGERKITRIKDVRFYTRTPDYERGSSKTKRALEYAQVVKCDRVYVKMTSPSESVRAKYDGWYMVDTENGTLTDPWRGYVLPLEGIAVSFFCYSTGTEDRHKPNEFMQTDIRQ